MWLLVTTLPPPRLPVQLSDLCLSPLLTSSLPDGDYSEQSQFVFIYFSRTGNTGADLSGLESFYHDLTSHQAPGRQGWLGLMIYFIKLAGVLSEGKGRRRKKCAMFKWECCDFAKLCQRYYINIGKHLVGISYEVRWRQSNA